MKRKSKNLKNKIETILYVSTIGIVFLFLILSYVVNAVGFSTFLAKATLKNIVFVFVFASIFIFGAQSFLFLYKRILKIFSIQMKSENVIFIIMSQDLVNTNIFKNKKSKWSSVYNLLGDLLINWIFVIACIVIFITSFFISNFLVFKLANFV